MREELGGLGQEAGRLADLRQQVDLEVGREGVGQAHVAREGGQDQVAHLDAAGGDHIAQREVVLAQELGEVMQQDQEDAQGALVQEADSLGQLSIAQVGLQQAQQGDQEALEVGPALVPWYLQQLGHELPAHTSHHSFRTHHQHCHHSEVDCSSMMLRGSQLGMAETQDG